MYIFSYNSVKSIFNHFVVIVLLLMSGQRVLTAQEIAQIRPVNVLDTLYTSQVAIPDTILIDAPANIPVQLGVFLGSELNFKSRERFGWKENYGVLVSTVTANSPAEIAGIERDDILTSFNHEKVFYKDQLTEMIRQTKPGERVEIILFRDGHYMKTTVIMREYTNPETETPAEKNSCKSNQYNWHDGYTYRQSGGINWLPMWYSPDWSDIDHLAGMFGFNSFAGNLDINGKNYPGILLHSIMLGSSDPGRDGSGGIQISVGNQFTKTGIYKSDSGLEMEERLDFDIEYYGVYIDHHIFSISRNLNCNGRALFGLWNNSATFSRQAATPGWNELTGSLGDPENFSITLQKQYYLIHPTVSLVLRIGDTLGIQAGLGYVFGFSRHNGWKVKTPGNTYSVTNSPDTNISGITFSIGPWLNME